MTFSLPPEGNAHLLGWRSPSTPPMNRGSAELQRRDTACTDLLSGEPQHRLRKVRAHWAGGCWRWMFSGAGHPTFIPFIQRPGQNVGFWQRQGRSILGSFGPASVRNVKATSSDSGLEAPFCTPHVRCTLAFSQQCRHHNRHGTARCGPPLRCFKVEISNFTWFTSTSRVALTGPMWCIHEKFLVKILTYHLGL